MYRLECIAWGADTMVLFLIGKRLLPSPMRRATLGLLLLPSLAAVLPVSASAAGPNDPPAIDFNREIRPILAASCYQCHGPDHNKRKADLRLDTREGLFRVVEGTAVVAPGKPETSELLRRITTGDDLERMPPAKSGAPLTAAQLGLIEQLDSSRRSLERPLVACSRVSPKISCLAAGKRPSQTPSTNSSIVSLYRRGSPRRLRRTAPL